ncbi:polysaccharide export protein [Desulfovibrio sp. X2]|uniref:polysaccharide biosynthesis/export family protein n=1 Tax=Desulfovibrio sp. X2 TaxID=941449 RepID=UPI000358949F|nr:polysaccharide biosynthesis/export family protein [Desulfovibrio sp. X2]EPR37248.1 polysaccharide export protein [Desulfovibrio sp. X2]
MLRWRNIFFIYLCTAALLAAAVLASSPAMAEGDYVIGAGDNVSVAVWGEDNLNSTALVRPDGKITVPGIGDVVAQGKTSVELQKDITQKLSKLIKDPIVTVTLVNVVNSKAYIVGGGVKSGVYNLQTQTSLLQLLAAVDLSTADLHKAHVIREGKHLDVDFYKLYHDGDISQDITLENNDIVFFPAMTEPYVYVLGAVNNPHAVPYREGLTVLDAILACGGFNKFADRDSTVIVRRNGEKETKITVKAKKLLDGKDLTQNVVLEQGDYLIANESFF